MHWLVLCMVSGQSPMWLAGIAMLISHAIISTNSFLIVDSVARRYKTRLINEVSGICFLNTKLFLMAFLNLLVFLGFPGSLFFLAEFMFFSYLWDLFPLMYLLVSILIYLILACFYMKVWMNLLFGSPYLHIKLTLDLDKSELLIFSSLIVLIFWLGFTWYSFII
jgi:NADH:ubiquinone oxidoreductase subunit 4 (subunit M)